MGINLFEITGVNPADPEVIAAGEDFDDFANLITSLVCTRKDRGLSQKKIAAIMGTKQSVVSDLERVGGNPTIRTIQRYARAVGCRVRFVPLVTRLTDWQEAGSFKTAAAASVIETSKHAPDAEFRWIA